MANQLIGTIVQIGPTQSITAKSGVTFVKRGLVIAIQKFDPNTGEPYSDNTNTPMITFMGDKGADLDNFQPGQVVRVSIDITGRSYEASDHSIRYINDVRGYKIELYARHQTPAPVDNNVPQFVEAEEVYPEPPRTQQAQVAPAPPVTQSRPKKEDDFPF